MTSEVRTEPAADQRLDENRKWAGRSPGSGLESSSALFPAVSEEPQTDQSSVPAPSIPISHCGSHLYSSVLNGRVEKD